MMFHVTPSGRSFSQIHYISSSSDDSEGDEADDDKSRLKTSSSSSGNSCILGVTSSNLRLNRVNLAKSFMMTNGLHKSWCEIDLINLSGKSWAVRLRYNKGTGQDFIGGGWTSFCHENELKTGCFYRFELVRTGTRPALKLCSKAKVSAKPNREGERSSKNRSKFMTVTLKPYMLKSRQLYLGSSFARENGIKKGGMITLVDKNGGAWPSCVASANVQGWVYLAKGWIECCKASGITMGETFTLKFVREKGKTPMLQFFSKAKTKIVDASRDEEETETRFQKKARVSHKSTADRNNVQCKQPLQTICHQVKQSIVNVLADVRRFRSELEIEEHNLEAVLQEIDVLGMI